MRTIDVVIKLSKEECQELVSWLSGRIIDYRSRSAKIIIDGTVIIDQRPFGDCDSDEMELGKPVHTGYTLDNLGLEKEEGDGSDKY